MTFQDTFFSNQRLKKIRSVKEKSHGSVGEVLPGAFKVVGRLCCIMRVTV